MTDDTGKPDGKRARQVIRHMYGHLLLAIARWCGAPEYELAPRRARMPCRRNRG